MSWGFRFRPYVPVGKRRANAARELAKLTKKGGKTANPVVISGRTIASTFWGKAWCDHLEAFSDFENRLPRGRTYVRNGSVVDLQIAKGSVTSRVSGSDLYRIEITIRPLATNLWDQVRKECSGKIDSILELLQGRLSAGVMEIVTRPDRGLFPTPREIQMKCSCPDWAEMCKHVAATLYGVGARLDTCPELLFLLRGVDPEELIAGVTGKDAVASGAAADSKSILAEKDLSAVFGIELDAESEATAPKRKGAALGANTPPPRARRAPAKGKAGKTPTRSKPGTGAKPETARKKRPQKPRNSSQAR